MEWKVLARRHRHARGGPGDPSSSLRPREESRELPRAFRRLLLPPFGAATPFCQLRAWWSNVHSSRINLSYFLLGAARKSAEVASGKASSPITLNLQRQCAMWKVDIFVFMSHCAFSYSLALIIVSSGFHRVTPETVDPLHRSTRTVLPEPKKSNPRGMRISTRAFPSSSPMDNDQCADKRNELKEMVNKEIC